MTTYYAICHVNGPISRSIDADSIEDAVAQFEAADTQAWIDEPATDAEDGLDIDGDGKTESEMEAAMEAAGYGIARDLSSVVCGQGPTTRSAHVADGWLLFAVESLPVTVRAWDDGSSETVEVEHGADYEEAAKTLWAGADYGNGDYRVTVQWEATDAAGDELESGSFDVEGETEEPECPESDKHEWTSEHEGGCRENPGCWSTGGTSMTFVAHCRHCGMERRQKVTGSQYNPGECDTTDYSEPDSEWVEEHYGD